MEKEEEIEKIEETDELEINILMVINKELVDFLSNVNLSFNEVVICNLLFSNEVLLLEDLIRERSSEQKIAIMQSFERKGLVKFDGVDKLEFDINKYSLTTEGELLVSNTIHLFMGDDNITFKTPPRKDISKTKEFQDLVDRYIDLFPKGKKNGGGVYIKSTRKDIESKFKTFFVKYGKYDYDLILKVTEKYVKSQMYNNYSYCSTAKFYIIKDSTSKLADDCDNYIEGDDSGNIEGDFTQQLM